MPEYFKTVDIRWSDLDPNFHVRHSAYYDFGAYCRMCFLTEYGSTPQLMLQHKIGPVLLREECVFKRELHFGDAVQISLYLKESSRDFSRWTIVHELIKNENKTAAIITVNGAWIDTERRKLIPPPAFALATIEQMSKSSDFEWI